MRKPIVRVISAILIGVFLLGAVAYLLRDTLATALVGIVLDRQPSLRCNHPDVAVSRTMTTVTLSPLDCAVLKGPVVEASTPDMLVVSLRHFTASRVTVHKGTMNQRERDLSNVSFNLVGDLTAVASFRDQLVKTIMDNSENYVSGGPEVVADALTMERAGKKESILYGFRKSMDGDSVHVQTARVGVDSNLVSVTDLDMHVTPSQGNLKVNVYIGKARPGHEPDLRLRFDGTRLNTKHPHFDIKL